MCLFALKTFFQKIRSNTPMKISFRKIKNLFTGLMLNLLQNHLLRSLLHTFWSQCTHQIFFLKLGEQKPGCQSSPHPRWYPMGSVWIPSGSTHRLSYTVLRAFFGLFICHHTSISHPEPSVCHHVLATEQCCLEPSPGYLNLCFRHPLRAQLAFFVSLSEIAL